MDHHYGFETENSLQAAGNVKPVLDTVRPVAIIDDSADDQLLLMHELEHLFGSVPVIAFADGNELVQYLYKHVKENEKPRMIFLDLNMKGMDGIATLELLQDRLDMANIPIVIISGTHNAAQVRKAFEFGAHAFLPKPVSRWDMMKVLHSKPPPGVVSYR